MSEVKIESQTENVTVSGGLAKNRLGVISIAFFTIAAAAPIAAYVGASPVLFSLVGSATPLVYLIAAALVALFSVGFLKMSQTIVNAGGFVAYIAQGLGNKIAAGAAGIAIFTYVTLQVGLFSQYGVFANQLFKTFAGIDLPPLFWIVVTLLAVTILTIVGVDASLKVLGILIAAEVLTLVVLLIGFIANHGFAIFSFQSMNVDSLFSPGFGIALLFAFLCFTTFEATVVFAEEARNPRKTVPRAMYLVIAFVAVFYFIATLATQGVVGSGQIQDVATVDPQGFIFTLATVNSGQWLNVVMQILVVTSFIAMLLGIFNMFARYLFALGRAGVLPKALKGTNAKGAPIRASIVNAILVTIILGSYLIAGTDPWVVYYWFSALGTVGFITILLLTSIAIVVYFAKKRIIANPLATIVAPALSVVAFVYIAFLTWQNFDVLSGGDPTARVLVLLLPIMFAAGVIIAVVKKNVSFVGSKL